MRTTHCTLHTPGHSVHYLQSRRITDFARRFPDRCVPVTVRDLGAGWFEMPAEGGTRLSWNHDPDLVTDVARDSVYGEVVHVPDFEALVRWVGGNRAAGPVEGSGTVLIPAWGGARPCLTVDGYRGVRQEARDER
ncbi:MULTISPECIES: hypothetical protein [Corynebacterium]|jgi:hypothetical protein|uniref:Uncharacterized protein n=1 Tax=Corynebacterium provencense TaxID=1737425 RepID=A0A2Z3YY24_9CORY|nr:MULTISPECIES: hypothetical protein [Corynebacterium]AWT26997.1 hypothetical protein Csp1_22470 [Corynebacterium provencense]MCI1255173.1 hypothetical protein [Corynebacterium provencense]